MILLARFVEPHEYGTFALAAAIVSVCSFFGSWGLDSVVLRDLTHRSDDVSTIATNYSILRMLGAVLAPITALAYASLAHPSEAVLSILVLILSLSSTFAVLDSIDLTLQSVGRAKLTSCIRLASFAIAAGIKCALILNSANLVWIALAFTCETLISSTLYAIVASSIGLKFDWRSIDFQKIREFFIHSRHMVLSGFTVVVYSKIDLLAIGHLLTRESVANYALATSVVSAWAIVGLSTSQAFAPQISRARVSGTDEYVHTLRVFLSLTLALSIIGVALMHLFGHYLMPLFLGRNYSTASSILDILAWIAIPSFLGIATSQIIVNEKLYSLSLLRTGLGMVVTLVLVVPVSRQFDVQGVAWLMICSSWIATLGILTSRKVRNLIHDVVVKPLSQWGNRS